MLDNRIIYIKLLLDIVVDEAQVVVVEVHVSDLGGERGLQDLPLELHGGGDEAGLRGPRLTDQTDGPGDLELLQPEQEENNSLKIFQRVTSAWIRDWRSLSGSRRSPPGPGTAPPDWRSTSRSGK